MVGPLLPGDLTGVLVLVTRLDYLIITARQNVCKLVVRKDSNEITDHGECDRWEDEYSGGTDDTE